MKTWMTGLLLAVCISINAQAGTAPKPKGGAFVSAAKEAIRQLKGLDSIVAAGVNYREYSQMVLDTKIKIDEFIDENSKSKNKAVISIKEAMDLYVEARKAWNAGLTKSMEEIPPESAINRCQEAKDAGKTAALPLPGYWRIDTFDNGKQALWACAKEEIAKASAALK